MTTSEHPDADLLVGAIDMHAHTSPSLFPRSIDDVQLAEYALAAGMRGFVLKDHDTPTATRAYHLRQRFPGLEAMGAIVLNRSAGGLDPHVVQSALAYGARVVWMPTNHSQYHSQYFGITDYPQMGRSCAQLKGDGLTILENGRITDKVLQIVDLVAEAGACLATGHLDENEVRLLQTEALARGVERFLVTHVNWALSKRNMEAQQALLENGAHLEYVAITYSSPSFREQTAEEFAEWMNATRGEGVIIASDLGQSSGPPHPEGIRMLLHALLGLDVPYEYLSRALRDNPARLCGLTEFVDTHEKRRDEHTGRRAHRGETEEMPAWTPSTPI